MNGNVCEICGELGVLVHGGCFMAAPWEFGFGEITVRQMQVLHEAGFEGEVDGDRKVVRIERIA